RHPGPPTILSVAGSYAQGACVDPSPTRAPRGRHGCRPRLRCCPAPSSCPRARARRPCRSGQSFPRPRLLLEVAAALRRLLAVVVVVLAVVVVVVLAAA